MLEDILKPFYNACNPLKPATPQYYVDADEARGSSDFANEVIAELGRVEHDFLTLLFAGHIGCGKSSELHHVAHRLDSSAANPYFPVILDAEEFIDTYDVEPSDVLLSILARFAQEMKRIGIELEDSYLHQRLSGLKDILFSHVAAPDVSVKVPMKLAEVTAKFSLLKSDPGNREKVREALGTDISPLKAMINLQFEKARGLLRKKKGAKGKPYADFFLILDNLEKINRVKGERDGYESHRQFFIDSASQLTGLDAHIIYTVPLPLVIRDGNELSSRYGTQPFVLPMIKVENRLPNRSVNERGLDILAKMLQKRAHKEVPLDTLIEKDALDFLLRNSGGHTRQLMIFMRAAITHTKKAPIKRSAAYAAIANTVSTYSRMPRKYWDILAALECSEQQDIDSNDADVKTMLQQLIILEYRNGGKEDDAYVSAAPWYAVHPIVRELPQFKRAVERFGAAPESDAT